LGGALKGLEVCGPTEADLRDVRTPHLFDSQRQLPRNM
jgi:hypothetical protein